MNTVIKVINEIEIEVTNGTATYRVDGNTPAQTALGQEDGRTLIEAYKDGDLYVAGEESGMMYGALYTD